MQTTLLAKAAIPEDKITLTRQTSSDGKEQWVATLTYSETITISCLNVAVEGHYAPQKPGSVTDNSRNTFRLIIDAIKASWFPKNLIHVHVRGPAHDTSETCPTQPRANSKQVQGTFQPKLLSKEGEKKIWEDQKHLTANVKIYDGVTKEEKAHIYLLKDNDELDISEAVLDQDPGRNRNPFPAPQGFFRNGQEPKKFEEPKIDDKAKQEKPNVEEEAKQNKTKTGGISNFNFTDRENKGQPKFTGSKSGGASK